jgi:hypothetical protein
MIVADVCIICPIPVAASVPLSLTNARKPAQLARSGKETKYKAACDANGLELLPICIESTGDRWGKACDAFFKKVLKANSKGNESVYRASSNYWLSRLSCCLQKSIAASIVNRSKLINGDMMLYNPNQGWAYGISLTYVFMCYVLGRGEVHLCVYVLCAWEG